MYCSIFTHEVDIFIDKESMARVNKSDSSLERQTTSKCGMERLTTSDRGVKFALSVKADEGKGLDAYKSIDDLMVRRGESCRTPLPKLTVEKLKRKCLFETKNVVSILKNMETYIDDKGEFSGSFQITADRLRQLHFALKKAPLEAQRDYKKAYGKIIAEQDGVKALCDIIIYCDSKDNRYPDGDIIPGIFDPFVNCCSALQNFSDANPGLTYLIVDHPTFLKVCGNFIHSHVEEHIDQSIQREESRILGQMMAIVHNIVQKGDHIETLRSLEFVEIFTPYLNSPVIKTLLVTLATLADIVNESEAERLEANGDFFNVLVTYLSKAMGSWDRRYNGWRAAELGRTIRRIARNDAHKTSLVENGSLPLLVILAKSEDIEERIEGVKALRTLSFSEDNQDAMISRDKGLVLKTLIELSKSTDSIVSKACTGALWNMREKLTLIEEYRNLASELKRCDETAPLSPKEKQEQKRGHVMISYQWGSQSVIKQIRDVIRKNGIKVWMDIDDMEGSTLVAMARAVEDADIVLICYSQKYKHSDNCRAEAEYAFHLKKKIIPLKMERNYKPDGWLGFIIGTKLYYEFGEGTSLETGSERLLKAIRKTQQSDAIESVIFPQKVVPLGLQPSLWKSQIKPMTQEQQLAATSVKIWTQNQVIKWIEKHGLSRHQFEKLSGMEIVFLQVLRKECPDYFYKVLSANLEISDLSTLAKFTFALDDTNI